MSEFSVTDRPIYRRETERKPSEEVLANTRRAFDHYREYVKDRIATYQPEAAAIPEFYLVPKEAASMLHDLTPRIGQEVHSPITTDPRTKGLSYEIDKDNVKDWLSGEMENKGKETRNAIRSILTQIDNGLREAGYKTNDRDEKREGMHKLYGYGKAEIQMYNYLSNSAPRENKKAGV